MSAPRAAWRCTAAHTADPRPCQGQPDAVRIVDQAGASTEGCVLHGAVLLASLVGGRVYPFNGPEGSALEVFERAQTLPAFDFLTDPDTLWSSAAIDAAASLATPDLPDRGNETPPGYGARDDWSETEQGVEEAATGSAMEHPDTPGAASAQGNGSEDFAWSHPGNARSSRWTETAVSGPRGDS